MGGGEGARNPEGEESRGGLTGRGWQFPFLFPAWKCLLGATSTTSRRSAWEQHWSNVSPATSIGWHGPIASMNERSWPMKSFPISADHIPFKQALSGWGGLVGRAP